MFKENDLVRLITESGGGEVMRVTDDSDTDDGTTCCEIASEDKGNDILWHDTGDLELVTDELFTSDKECKPMETNTPTRTHEDIHEDISKMFIQLAQFAEERLDGQSIEIKIETEHYSGNDLDINFSARVGYGAWVTSTNLFKSAEIALTRHTEDKGLKPLSIPMYKEAAE
jgi:hypothetical protein